MAAGVRLRSYEIERLLSSDGSFGLVYVASDLDPDRVRRRRESLARRADDWRRPNGSLGYAAALAAEPSAGPKVVIKEFFPRELAERAPDGRSVAARSGKARLYDWSRARFGDEAKFLMGHGHPNIVSVFDVVSANNTEYMVMELLTGGALMDAVAGGGAHSEREVRRWLLPLLRALQSIERHGVDHLDLSPSNIVYRGPGGDPVLVDFGAARMRAPPQGRNTRLMVNNGYSAPEKYRTTSRGLDSRADIYGLGGVINYALTGERPHDAMERIADPAKVGGLSRQAAAVRGRQASAKFLSAVDACFSLSLEARPANAAVAEQVFAPWQDVAAPRNHAPAATERSTPRRRALVAFLALLLLLLALLLAAPALAAHAIGEASARNGQA